MVQIIFSDIDGTLINSQFQVTEATKHSIQEAVRQGMVFVPVSARMPEAIKPIMDSIGIVSPIISYNGALIQNQAGETVASHPMETADAVADVRFICQAYPAVAWNVYSYHNWYSADRSNEWIVREEAIVGLESKEASLSDLEGLKAVHKVLLMGEPQMMTSLEAQLKNRYPSLSITQSAPYFIEIMAQGVEKSAAVQAFTEYLGVQLEETIAFGDNFNDVAMLQTVGKGYVMGNGPAAVQQAIGNVTDDHNHDGIAAVLNSYLY